MRCHARAAAVLGLLSALVWPARPCGAEDVRITNLPDVQRVRLTELPVEVRGRVDATRFAAFEDRNVPPNAVGAQPRDLVALGLIDATGFATATVSLALPLPPTARESGHIGLLLVPDVAAAKEAMTRDGSTPFAVRVELPLAGSTGLNVVTTSAPLPLAFPRWNAWLYNTTSTSVRLHAYVMLGD